jgi:hypothetical protein
MQAETLDNLNPDYKIPPILGSSHKPVSHVFYFFIDGKTGDTDADNQITRLTHNARKDTNRWI